MLNLLTNAVKFAAGGEVTISSSDDLAEPGGVRIQVADSGPGMDEKVMATLFTPFAVGDGSMTRSRPGLGLGLAIAQRLSLLMNARLEVASSPGMGATFTVTLPPRDKQSPLAAELLTAMPSEHDAPAEPARLDASAPVQPSVPSPASPPAAHAPAQNQETAPLCAANPTRPALAASALLNMRLLLAEDGPDNQRLFMAFLRRAGASVTVVPDGLAAIGAFQNAPEPFHAVILDMQMPVMDGYTAAGRIRELGWTGPVLALTAHALEGEKERCLAAGCSGFMSKPISSAALVSQIRAAIDQHVSVSSANAANTMPVAKAA